MAYIVNALHELFQVVIMNNEELFREVHYFEIWYGHLEEIIELVYGQPFDAVADQEWYNDTAIEFYLRKEDNLGSVYESRILDFIETGKHSFLLSGLLEDMNAFDILPDGSYLVQVSW